MIKSTLVLGALAIGFVSQADPYVELSGLVVADVVETYPSADLLLDLEPVEGMAVAAHAARVRAVARTAGLAARRFGDALGCDPNGDPRACRFSDSNQILLRLGHLQVDGDRATFGVVTYTPAEQGYHLGSATAVFEHRPDDGWVLTEWIPGATT